MNETNINPILSIHDLYVDYNSQSSLSLPWEKKQIINAVNGVSFNLHEGKTLGIVGETGCGKSTIAKAIIKLTSVKSGQIFWMGNNLLDWVITGGYELRTTIFGIVLACGQAQTVEDWQNGLKPETYIRLTLINPF